jgi:hypothetical protein
MVCLLLDHATEVNNELETPSHFVPLVRKENRASLFLNELSADE